MAPHKLPNIPTVSPGSPQESSRILQEFVGDNKDLGLSLNLSILNFLNGFFMEFEVGHLKGPFFSE